VIYSEASGALERLVSATGIPVGETQAGKGAIPWDHPQCLGGVGATGTLAANLAAASADLVIGIGTRYSDFTTASKTAFAKKNVRFININVTEFDAGKHDAIALVGDARVVIEELISGLAGFQVAPVYESNLKSMKELWDLEVDRLIRVSGGHSKLPWQAAVIGALNRNAEQSDVLINAAGSAPGDLHKLGVQGTQSSTT
jgi:3D-(3,5/4)-trihydroxycyclohexane-1,2-dione acylhydrolase (decyclizing)